MTHSNSAYTVLEYTYSTMMIEGPFTFLVLYCSVNMSYTSWVSEIVFTDPLYEAQPASFTEEQVNESNRSLQVSTRAEMKSPIIP